MAVGMTGSNKNKRERERDRERGRWGWEGWVGGELDGTRSTFSATEKNNNFFPFF